MSLALDSGAKDFQSDEDDFIIISEKQDFESVKKKLISKGVDNFESELSMIPKFYQKLDNDEAKQKVLNFIDVLEDDDDVQLVWNNLQMDDDDDLNSN